MAVSRLKLSLQREQARGWGGERIDEFDLDIQQLMQQKEDLQMLEVRRESECSCTLIVLVEDKKGLAHCTCAAQKKTDTHCLCSQKEDLCILLVQHEEDKYVLFAKLENAKCFILAKHDRRKVHPSREAP